MSSETKRDPERFRHLERLFEALLCTHPSRWDEIIAERSVDPRLAVQARRLLLLERSGRPHRYLKHLISAAKAVVHGNAAEIHPVLTPDED